MASLTDMNIVLGQGNAIKEVHNVRKESLELNQPFVAQKAVDKKNEERSKIQKFDNADKVEIKGDEEKKNEENFMDSKDNEKESEKEKIEDDTCLSKGSIINIKV